MELRVVTQQDYYIIFQTPKPTDAKLSASMEFLGPGKFKLLITSQRGWIISLDARGVAYMVEYGLMEPESPRDCNLYTQRFEIWNVNAFVDHFIFILFST